MISNNENEIKHILEDTDIEQPLETKEISPTILLKKRGRKPNSILKKKEIKNEVHELKKRGRKPTCKIINTLDLKSYKSNMTEECLIIHLPLTKNDINSISKIDNINIEDKNKIDKIIQKENIDNIYNDNNNNIINRTIKKENIDYTYDNNIKCINCIHLQKQINKLERIKCNNIIHNINIKLEDIYTGNDILLNKNIVCWWCCHSFESLPIGLPEKYYENIFYVIGYFCSFNCAMSYNLSLNDYKIWERISLLYFLKQYININTEKTIIMAPPRCMLKIFGGILSIEEFREKSIIFKRQFRNIIFPIISLNKQIEESDYTDEQNMLLKSINCKKKNINDTELVLKRSKPLNKSSLFKMMNIQNINE